MNPRMREEPTRSLLLLDANPEERRLISAIAGRAGWSVVASADEEMALALLQGPHGREVLAALLGGWDAEKGPQLIASLREHRPNLPVIVLSGSEMQEDMHRAFEGGANSYLVKPSTFGSLVTMVKDIGALLPRLPKGGASRSCE